VGLKQRYLLFNAIILIVVAAITLLLTDAWRKIDAALVRDDYASRVESQTFLLQYAILSEPMQPSLEDSDWLISQRQLLKLCDEVPDLTAAEQSLQHSIRARSESLRSLYLELRRLNQAKNDLPVEQLLRSRLLMQIVSIREDSERLAALAKADIRHIVNRQLLWLSIALILGTLTFVSGVGYFGRLVRRSITELRKGFAAVAKGQLHPIKLSHTVAEFEALVKPFNDMTEQLQKSTVTREVLQQIVNERTAVLKEIASTDPLTQTANRRALFERGNMEYSRATRHDARLSLLIIDCDYFKNVNDEYGHLVGDSLLVHLCQTLQKQIRDIDFLARYGGEEFVVLLPDCDLDNAVHKANVIRDAVAKNHFYKEGQLIEMTISLGVACLDASHPSFEKLLQAADDALLEAKNQGRNRVVVAH